MSDERTIHDLMDTWVRRVFQSMVPMVRTDATHETRKIQAQGDIAWCWSYPSVTITPRHGGQPSRRSGHTLSILRREPGGNWVVIRDANLLTAV